MLNRKQRQLNWSWDTLIQASMIGVCAIHCPKCVAFVSLNCEGHNDCQPCYVDNTLKAQKPQVPSP